MPPTLRCDCGRSFEVPVPAGPFAACPDCGREVPVVGDARATAAADPPASPSRWWAVPLWTIGLSLMLGALFLPAVRTSREAARRSQCVNNLKQIGLALENYRAAYGCLPPAASVDAAGRPLLSWRVLVLPFIECNPMFLKFRLDEPWDSPHNRPLVAQMPRIYACPSDAGLGGPDSGLTGYQVVVGPETAFPPDHRPVRLDDIADGASGTLLVGEATRPVPWTKPDDLRADDPAPLLGFGSLHPGGFNTGFVDGSVRFLKNTIRPATLRALLTRAGGEAISADQY